MRIINMHGAPLSFKVLLETYLEMCFGWEHPTQIFMSPAIVQDIERKYETNLYSQAFDRFQDAHIVQSLEIGNSVWLRNTNRPIDDTIIIGVSAQDVR